jgi:hypothetical protein
MREHTITDSRDRRGKRRETGRSRARRSGLVRLGLLGLLMLVALGNRSCEENTQPTLPCSDISVRVEPGTCTAFQNPCADNLWSPPFNPDGFRLDDPGDEQRSLIAAAPPYVRTTRTAEETTREICIPANSALIPVVEFPFTYARGDKYGRADFFLTVAPQLTLNVTASPSAIAVGDSSQLVAAASGGIPPYFYRWNPDNILDYPNIAAPITKPNYTTTYSVAVTDSGGQRVTVPVTISVGLELAVSADPPAMSVGEVVGLRAFPVGGTPPYTFSWTPAEGLDNPLSESPIATPAATTTYNVTVTDAEGATKSGSIEVPVASEPLRAFPSANPRTIQAGKSSDLDVVVTGGFPPYTYSWRPADSLSNPSIRNPVASPASTEFYWVTVTDAKGLTFSQEVTVGVVSSTPLTAAFSSTVTCCPTLNLDASASTGSIFFYTWDLSWTAASPDAVSLSPTATFRIQEFNRGTIQLTVTDFAGSTATTTRSF